MNYVLRQGLALLRRGVRWFYYHNVSFLYIFVVHACGALAGFISLYLNCLSYMACHS